MSSNKNPRFSGKIGVCGLASPSEPTRFKRALSEISGLGLKVKVPFDPTKTYAKKSHLFSCGSAAQRVRALESLFADKSIDAVFASRGGYGSMELLPLLNYAKLKEGRKPLVGFSDITALLVALFQESKLPVIHGPAIEGGFCEYSTNALRRKSADVLLRLLAGDLPKELTCLKGKLLSGSKREVVAPLLGGNLAILSSLLGTPWQPDFSGKIVFLEDVGERPYRIHRQMTQLRLAGCFKKAKGIYLGSFSGCEDPSRKSPTLRAVFEDVFRLAAFPVVGFGPFGHQDLNLPMPFGVKARLSSRGFELLSGIFQS